MDFQIVLPGKTLAGKGALSRAGLEKYGKKPLIVTGKHTAKSAAAAELLKYAPAGVIFDGITGEPTVGMINSGVGAYHDNSCDYVIGIGGGSALDSAKAIAAMSALGGNIADYMGKEIDGEFPPMVLIPTTAGTGSEATKFTIITDTEKDIKMLLKGDKLLPDLAVLDYSYTFSAPKSVTAATGMDALTHAIESYTSRRANPITDTFALSALKRIFANLPTAYNEPENETAREQMLIAAYEAGVCINNASVTIVHGMSRPIGALFHVPHGISNAMLDIKSWGLRRRALRINSRQLPGLSEFRTSRTTLLPHRTFSQRSKNFAASLRYQRLRNTASTAKNSSLQWTKWQTTRLQAAVRRTLSVKSPSRISLIFMLLCGIKSLC